MQIRLIPKNEDIFDPANPSAAPLARWKAWAGKSAFSAMVYLDQRSPQMFRGSIPYILDLARRLKGTNPQVQPIVNVPFPGVFQMGAVANGEFDGDYRDIARGILALHSSLSDGKIEVRLPWEHNLDGQMGANGLAEGQPNTAKDRSGRFNPGLYVLAYRRIALIFRQESKRFWLNWCPNHGKQLAADGLEVYYPGDDVVDEVGLDFYLDDGVWSGATADWAFAPASGYGFDWLIAFAKKHGKPWSIPELGAGQDHFAPVISEILRRASAAGCRWVGWYDRNEGPWWARISTGERAAIGAVVKAYI